MTHLGETLKRGQSDLHPPAPNQTLPAYILPPATPCLHPPRDQIDLCTACFWHVQQQTAMFHLSSSVTHLPLSSPSMQTHLQTATNANVFVDDASVASPRYISSVVQATIAVAGFMFGMHHVLDDKTDKLY